MLYACRHGACKATKPALEQVAVHASTFATYLCKQVMLHVSLRLQANTKEYHMHLIAKEACKS